LTKYLIAILLYTSNYLVVMTNEKENRASLPTGNVLMVHPHYVHYSGEFARDETPFLPLGLLYAGQILEENRDAIIQYHDCQLHNISEKDNLDDYDSIGIHVMGAQNIAPAHEIYDSLLERGIKPERIYFGGQGVEDLEVIEFESVFPNANLVRRRELVSSNYWNVSIRDQLDKLPEDDLKTYFSNELTLLLSQGCMFSCNFCGAETGKRETFYDTKDNLRAYFETARKLEIDSLDAYVTSLDFFQQALKGGDVGKLKQQLKDVVELQEEYGINLRLRALTRADSYMLASEDEELVDLVKKAGFYQFGFGADGAANVKLLQAMKKGTADLESKLLESFDHAEKNGFIPEILYVFGIEEDTEETLEETRKLCEGLLNSFSSSIYRGFPAKNFIPGNRNWKKPDWKQSEAYQKLLENPELFGNLGFEALANNVSHPNEKERKLVNRFAVEMSYVAHQLGRVQSFLTVPIMETDGHELMDEDSFKLFREIIDNYAPEFSRFLTLDNLPEYRTRLNRLIPKDT
jgi:hypothetical protein